MPFSSINDTPSRNVPKDGAVPPNWITTLLMATSPALDAVKVKVARLSTVVLARPEVVPSAVELNEILLLKAVIVLPAAEDKVMAEVAFEVAPKATTASATVSFTESVDVAILKTCVVLSDAPDEEYEDTSPFKTMSIEFACGTVTGVAKWNW